MQFSRETSAANLIGAWEVGRVRIGESWFHGPLIVASDRIIDGWQVSSPDELTLAQLEPAVALKPELILLGTGMNQAMPDIALMSALAELRVGLEIMTTPAACRTYNVLIHERRPVVAALFNPPE